MAQLDSKTVLCIGASDSSGFTGIQMDIKTAQSFGCQVKTVVTCLYARNQSGAKARHILPDDFVKEQIRTVLEEEPVHAVKIGDLCHESIIHIVADVVDTLAKDGIKIVVDPVLTTHCGTFEMSAGDKREFQKRLPVRADVFTPSLLEAEMLTGIKVESVDEIEKLIDVLHSTGAKNIVLRGGQLSNEDKVLDIVSSGDGLQLFETTLPLEQYGARGVGAATATGIACGIAQGLSLHQSIDRSRRFVNDAMRAAKIKHGGRAAVDPIDAMIRLYELGL